MTASGEAFRELLDLLREADQTFLAGPRAVSGETAIVEGHRSIPEKCFSTAAMRGSVA